MLTEAQVESKPDFKSESILRLVETSMEYVGGHNQHTDFKFSSLLY